MPSSSQRSVRRSSATTKVAPLADEPHQDDYVERNRAAWERWAPQYRAAGRRAWADDELRWGMWGLLESEVELLGWTEPGMNAIEFGCGTGHVCAWMARAGLRPLGIDISQAQVDAAETFQRQFDVPFRLDRVNAEAVPYDDESFDVAISEYGASVWCDPHRWLPEAARLLRPGGMLVFIVNSPLLMTCTPTAGGAVGERLERSYFGMYRFEFAGDDAVEFHLGHGDWFSVLAKYGFAVENLLEVRPGPDVPPRYNFVSNQWARRWPSEDIWTARRQ